MSFEVCWCLRNLSSIVIVTKGVTWYHSKVIVIQNLGKLLTFTFFFFLFLLLGGGGGGEIGKSGEWGKIKKKKPFLVCADVTSSLIVCGV